MVNLYKLTNLLESGMTIFQLNQWKNEGIWYPITQYKKESNEIEVVTNVFTPLSEENPRFHIQLSANYDTEKAEWNQFLEDNQWKLYPLLRNILNVFLPRDTLVTAITVGATDAVVYPIPRFLSFWSITGL